MSTLLILNYHAFASDNTEELKDPFSLKFSQFFDQLNWIEKSQIPIVSLSNWQENPNSFNKLSIALTFDDACVSQYDFVLPELLKRNFPASFFPIVGKIGETGFLSWSQLQEMLDEGFEIGSHGMSHKRLTSVSNEILKEEIVHSKQLLEQKLNHSVSLFSLPFGVHSKKVLRSLSSQYSLVLTTGSIVNTDDSTFLMHRFNIKNTPSIKDFQELINGKSSALRKRKICSTLALRFNRLIGFFDSFTKEKSRI